MSQQPPYQPAEPQKESAGTIVLKVLLVLVGVVVVLGLGIMLGMILTSSSRVDTTPPDVAPPTPAPDSPHLVANGAVNVRTGPSTDYPILGTASDGQAVEISGVSQDGGWWQIRIPAELSPDGLGWISGAYTTAYNAENVPVVEAPPPPPPVNPPEPPAGGNLVVTTEPLNIRSGPHSSYPSYGMVPRGTTLLAVGLSQDGRWVAVQIPTSVAPDGIGWVSGAYLEGVEDLQVPQM